MRVYNLVEHNVRALIDDIVIVDTVINYWLYVTSENHSCTTVHLTDTETVEKVKEILLALHKLDVLFSIDVYNTRGL